MIRTSNLYTYNDEHLPVLRNKIPTVDTVLGTLHLFSFKLLPSCGVKLQAIYLPHPLPQWTKPLMMTMVTISFQDLILAVATLSTQKSQDAQYRSVNFMTRNINGTITNRSSSKYQQTRQLTYSGCSLQFSSGTCRM